MPYSKQKISIFQLILILQLPREIPSQTGFSTFIIELLIFLKNFRVISHVELQHLFLLSVSQFLNNFILLILFILYPTISSKPVSISGFQLSVTFTVLKGWRRKTRIRKEDEISRCKGRIERTK